jgi:lipid-A-disaccharide synthase
VGNPVLEYIIPVSKQNPDDIRTGLGISPKPVVALLPGSRRQEITGMLPLMARVAEKFPDYQFIIAGHANFPESFYADLTQGRNLPVVYGSTLELLKVAYAAVINSGTATLEAALLGTPQVVCYRTNTLSYLIARVLIRVDYISLVNLILGKPCIKELIQRGCNDRNVERELSSLLNDEGYRKEVHRGYGELETLIGAGNASATAAAVICRVASTARQV